MTLHEFNELPAEAISSHLKNCCGSDTWCKNVLQHVPYDNAQTLLSKARSAWFASCNEADWLEAFSYHPRIGDKKAAATKLNNTRETALHEQSGVAAEDRELIENLQHANMQYEAKFGYTFIVCATGKSGHEMLEILQNRLNNTKAAELSIAVAEQWKITQIRMKKLLNDVVFPENKCQITTHILNTSIGKPAKGVVVHLLHLTDGEWQNIGKGRTNDDGRISDILASDSVLDHAVYKLVFEVEDYFDTLGQKCFYPEIQIIFTVSDGSHYHVPLLLNPFGYSTYRGS